MTMTVCAAQGKLLDEVTAFVESVYRTCGYIPPKHEGVKQYSRNNKNPFPPTTEVLVALQDETICGTITVTTGNKNTLLPCDESFPKETAELREQYEEVVYVGSFATSYTSKKGQIASIKIASALISEAFRTKGDLTSKVVVCIVNPKHLHFYLKMGFKEVAFVKNVPGLENAPGVMMSMTPQSMNRRFIERLTR